MIHYLRGTLIEKSPVHAVVEAGGIAYFLHITLFTFGRLSESGQVVLYTHLNISGQDYSLTLFGFGSEEERDLFRKLISVSGVGPNTARVVMSNLRPEELRHTILSRDSGTLRRIKGIGEKTAERIVLDLHDKIAKTPEGSLEKISVAHNKVKSEALMALTSLGVDRTKADKLAERLVAADPAITLEELIRQVLKQL